MVSAPSLSFQMNQTLKKILLTSIFLVVMVHALGILLPETGFDALWYHLPIVEDMVRSRLIRDVPGVSQSNQPRLGEIIYVPWFLLGGTMGVKVCTFLLMLMLLLLTYQLASYYLESSEALLLTLLVATFHTVAWGATSAYVDILRSVFELAALLAIRKRNMWMSGLFLGMALLTKSVALVFLPAFILLLIIKAGIKKTVGSTLILSCLFLPSQILGLLWRGTLPALEIGRHANNLILTDLGLLKWIVEGLSRLIFLPLTLSFHAESYTSPVFLFASPFIFYQARWLWRKYSGELIFLFISFLIWVFVVPVSVRYDLSAIILATIICFVAVMKLSTRYSLLKPVFYVFISLGIMLNMSIRLGATARGLPFLLGGESEAQYLKRFYQGILEGPLEKWYGRVQ